jgi:general secretion pathway protein D
MLRKIDVLPLQVRIDATIAEVTLNDALQYGTQFYFKNGGINGLLSSATSTSSSVPTNSSPGFSENTPGFLVNKSLGGIQFALSALQSVTNVRVLSSPQVLVLDNQEARFQVGDLVPYLTQSSQSTLVSNPLIVSNVEYRETGVILQVIPHVNNGGLVTLEISQEVSDVDTQTTVGLNTPTFLERRVKSNIVVQDGQTIGLAGLIRDTTSRSNSGIPYLKDIPVLGNLFSQQDNTRTRTELIVLITPHVMQDQRDARALTEDLRTKLPSAGLVPQQLDGLPLSGSSNPNAEIRE